MTDRIAEIRQRLDAITPGEWKLDKGIHIIYVGDTDDWSEGLLLIDVCNSRNDGDIELIASAPADMRYLLDEVERLQNLVDTQLLVITEISPVITEQAVKSAMKDLDSRLAGLINERLSPPQ